MSKPSWERQEELEDLETERLIQRQGEREDLQGAFNEMGGDYLGLDDGRPGISLDWDFFGGLHINMPWHWYFILSVAGVLLLLLAAFTFRTCARVSALTEPGGQPSAQPGVASTLEAGS